MTPRGKGVGGCSLHYLSQQKTTEGELGGGGECKNAQMQEVFTCGIPKKMFWGNPVADLNFKRVKTLPNVS